MGREEALDGSKADLDNILPSLKRSGCNILVTGKVDWQVSMQASQRMFGTSGTDRLRVSGLTRQAARKPNEWLPAEVERGDDAVRVVEFAECGLSSDSGLEESPEARIEPVREQLDCAIEELVAPIDPDPAQLRVGIYSLTPLIGRFGQPAVKALLDEIARIVDDNNGMGHYHLPRKDSESSMGEINSLFDVRVELRQTPSENPRPEQRWHVDGQKTGWIEL